MLSRVFRWPQGIEKILDSATKRVIQKKGVVESQLKSKRTEFEFEYGNCYFHFSQLNDIIFLDLKIIISCWTI